MRNQFSFAFFSIVLSLFSLNRLFPFIDDFMTGKNITPVFSGQSSNNQCYDPDLVEISNVSYNNEEYHVIQMYRDGGHVRAKYFAAPDFNGNNVFKRYSNWSNSQGNVILVSSGTYMDNRRVPVGLTIDNGIPVNETLVYDKMDALTIVYATGGIVVSNLKDGDLSVSGSGITSGRKLNLRRSASDMQDFIDWARDQEATVFQTHLLVYKNQLSISAQNSSTASRERRFLAVGKDENGKVVHLVVHCPVYSTLYEGSRKVLEFLNKYKSVNVTFMINLDTGAQDVFELYNSDCTRNTLIKGATDSREAVNLLAYYYE
jgi:hypothetical protein